LLEFEPALAAVVPPEDAFVPEPPPHAVSTSADERSK
jgi:hypothetical protein